VTALLLFFKKWKENEYIAKATYSMTFVS